MLEYSYAPEHPFPAQLEQMIAAYRYVTEEEGVSPGKIALAGDSAGGNLLLSFLTCLHSPLLPSWPKFSGPFLGLFLMSPWLGFSHSGSSFEANADLDCLRKSSLDTWASCFRAGSSLDQATIRAYTDFEGEDENRPSMATILTKRIAITAGGDELMVSSITSFADCAKKAGIEVSLDIAPGMVHDWQMIQSRNDEAGYLQILRSDSAKPHLDGAVEFGRLIVECMQAG
jgi:acetyl esterase/lipase